MAFAVILLLYLVFYHNYLFVGCRFSLWSLVCPGIGILVSMYPGCSVIRGVAVV